RRWPSGETTAFRRSPAVAVPRDHHKALETPPGPARACSRNSVAVGRDTRERFRITPRRPHRSPRPACSGIARANFHTTPSPPSVLLVVDVAEDPMQSKEFDMLTLSRSTLAASMPRQLRRAAGGMCSVLMALSALVPRAHADEVLNGGFETPSVPAGSFTHF